jgi:protoheme IX farnesyltransferase
MNEMSMPATAATAKPYSWGSLRSYWQLTKPKVVAAIVFTAGVGMLLASRGCPQLDLVLLACAGIWLAAASAAAVNHVIDCRIDVAMMRTRRRPLPSGRLQARSALLFAGALALASMTVLMVWVNVLTAVLTFCSLIGYSVIYTAFLKPLTPQNIVIGGAAGAAPPLLGWTAVSNGVDANALLLFLIVLVWTPPHFWALAIARRAEYAKAGVPMLPVTHGIDFTCTHILLYSILLGVLTVLPSLTGMTGFIYLAGSTALNVVFVGKTYALQARCTAERAMRVFRFSITYLLSLFALLLLDHYCRF